MTITFPDLSHFQAGVSLAGAVAVIAKATQGVTFVDPTYAANRSGAQLRGIPFAGYHWVDGSDLGAQAANAYRVMGATPCMWDAEAAGATVPRLVELTQRYRALGGNPRLVYLPHWWWLDHLGAPDLRPLANLGLALVSSNYSAPYSDTGPGWGPYGGVTPTIWQYTDKQPFNGRLVDFNAYRGTVEQLRALFNGQQETEGIAMFTAQISGSPACWVSDGIRYRPVPDGTTLQRLAQAGAHHVVVGNQTELGNLCGELNYDGPDPITLTKDQLDGLAAAAAIGQGRVTAAAVVDELAHRLTA